MRAEEEAEAAAYEGLLVETGVSSATPLRLTDGGGTDSSLITVTLGSSFTGAATNGVPSTGQKLNLSANSSEHLEQNFIDTTSSRLWGSCMGSDSPSAPENSLA